MNTSSFQMLLEATQMVLSTCATLQVTSALLGTFQEKILPSLEKSKNVPKTAKIEGYNTRFRISQGPSYGRHGMPLRTWKVIVKESCGLERICGCLYVHFEANLGFHEKWANGVFKGFSGKMLMVSSTRATLQVTSAFLGTFPEKIWPGPEKSKNVPKTAKTEVYNARTYSRLERWTPWDTS